MEMLVALMVFAVLTYMATQTLAGLAQTTASFWEHTDRFREEVTLERYLGAALRDRSFYPAVRQSACLDEAACWQVEAIPEGQVLTWWNDRGGSRRLPVRHGPYQISRGRQDSDLLVYRIARDSQEGRPFASTVSAWVPAPRNCRFNRIAGACLPPEAGE